MSGEQQKLFTVEDINAEIARLTKAREEQTQWLNSQKERENRRIRREQLAGLWVVTLTLGEGHLQAIREQAGADAWLFESSLLQLDGWEMDRNGQWTLPRQSPSEGAGR